MRDDGQGENKNAPAGPWDEHQTDINAVSPAPGPNQKLACTKKSNDGADWGTAWAGAGNRLVEMAGCPPEQTSEDH